MKYNFVLNNNDLEVTPIGWFQEEFKDLTIDGFEIYIKRILKQNGWEEIPEEENESGAYWKKDFIIEYKTTVYARIAYKPEHLGGSWIYGLNWLEAEYEYHDQYHGPSDLKDMKEAMRLAIEHLLAKGIPFHPESDIMHHNEDYWHITYQELKRNTDLLNATRLLEHNYNDIRKFECDNISEEEFEEMIKKRYWSDRDFSYGWMYEFFKKKKKEEENG